MFSVASAIVLWILVVEISLISVCSTSQCALNSRAFFFACMLAHMSSNEHQTNPTNPKLVSCSLSNLAKTGHMRWRCVRIYELPIKRSDLRTAGVILVLLATTPLFFTLAGHHCSRRSFLICQDQAENFHTGWRSGHSALAFVGGLFPHHHWRSNY